ncbi:MAG: bifunctional UDP-N-acetylglucosamine diphosphorylase/glucosamine-1-phosphate N-acetyltransferase GlmU [Acholeplasma sp.]|nr:bifunctional UDP-N-acetylglucosamine diphosphorylase/glucosamine-1-phosphate N-acetyltransferase GlmU [Acholeplasma sp.]
MKTYGLILAAGKGTRMQSDLPKCAYPILRKPMIEYIVENMESSVIDEVVVVIGHKREYIQDLLKTRVSYAFQEEQLGTGHAVNSAKELLGNKEGITFIIPGDVPLIPSELMDKIITAHKEMGNDLTVVSMNLEYPKSYGRIVRDEYGIIEAIVEEKDCNEYQKQIKEVNTGIYVVDNKKLFKVLDKIKLNERKNEYYLTDIVELMHIDYKVNSFLVRYPHLTIGVNDLYGISIAEKYLRESINRNHMLSGVSIVNPETVTIGHSVIIEKGVVLLPNTTITGNSIIKTGVIVGPNTEIHESVINENAQIKHSYVFNSEVGKNTTVGPFAHIRDHSVIGDNNRIGNFVEVKKSTTGNETKAAHLSYIGDSEVGNFVNFGCGSVTVNYDGKLKHKTKIGDDVFIGCNVNLIAPIEIGDNVFLAAGSTVTENVPSGSLAIARNRQINKSDYSKNLIKPKSMIEKENK